MGWRTAAATRSGHGSASICPAVRRRAKLFSYEVTRYPLSRERALLEEYRRTTWRLPEYNVSAA
jgi:hypothetical protein